jgi:tetratricopeptide (TPR) repeat protein
LEGFAVPDAPEFEDWLARERERVRAATLGTLVTAAERALAQGELDKARLAADRALALDPRHEPALRALMRAYALDGVRQLALEAFERASAALARDLGTEPEAATSKLAQRLRAGEVVRVTPRAPETAHLAPLVGAGRARLSRLVAVWEEAAGGARLVLVRGAPGGGKTRLLDELCARARLDDAVVAYARGLEGDDPRAITAAWLRGGLAVPEMAAAAPGALAGLAEVEPDVAMRFPGARAAQALPLDEALVAAVSAVAGERRVLLVLDDAHRGGPEIVAAAVRLAQRGSALPLMVLLAAPPAAVDPLLDPVSARLGTDLHGLELETTPLEETDIAEFAAWAVPAYGRDDRARLARRVMADTVGNPFLVTQIMLALRAGLAVSPGSGAAWPAAHRTLDDTLPGQLPPAVSAALRLRFRALTVPAQRTLASLAVLGGRTAPGALARAAEVGPEGVVQALDELEREGWIDSDAHGYSFVTRLAREVILADMVTGGEKRRIRERAQ